LSGLDEVDAIYGQLIFEAHEVGKRAVTEVGAPLGHLCFARKWGSVRSGKLGFVEDLSQVGFTTVHGSSDVDPTVELFVEPGPLAETIPDAEVVSVQLSAGPVGFAVRFVDANRRAAIDGVGRVLVLSRLFCRRAATEQERAEEHREQDDGRRAHEITVSRRTCLGKSAGRQEPVDLLERKTHQDHDGHDTEGYRWPAPPSASELLETLVHRDCGETPQDCWKQC